MIPSNVARADSSNKRIVGISASPHKRTARDGCIERILITGHRGRCCYAVRCSRGVTCSTSNRTRNCLDGRNRVDHKVRCERCRAKIAWAVRDDYLNSCCCCSCWLNDSSDRECDRWVLDYCRRQRCTRWVRWDRPVVRVTRWRCQRRRNCRSRTCTLRRRTNRDRTTWRGIDRDAVAERIQDRTERR